MTTFTVSTDERTELINITDRVEAAIPDDATGTATVFVRHTTAGIAVNEAESHLLDDMASFLDGTVADSGWAHDQLDDNADSHLRALLVGPSETVPVTDGRLDTGTWQSVLLVECDGPRSRTVDVRVSE
jgi:secondary thiamine-phosphate synthase enzyme